MRDALFDVTQTSLVSRTAVLSISKSSLYPKNFCSVLSNSTSLLLPMSPHGKPVSKSTIIAELNATGFADGYDVCFGGVVGGTLIATAVDGLTDGSEDIPIPTTGSSTSDGEADWMIPATVGERDGDRDIIILTEGSDERSMIVEGIDDGALDDKSF